MNNDKLINEVNKISGITEQLDSIDNKINYIYNVKSFKNDDGTYVKGNGSQDDTTGVQKALNTIPLGATLYFPSGEYRVIKTLTINRNICVDGENYYIKGSHNDLGIFIGDENKFFGLDATNKLSFKISFIRDSYNNSEGADGIKIVNAFGVNFIIDRVVNCNCGLKIIGANGYGTTYSRFDLRFLTDNYIGTKIETIGVKGYVTENTFYGGAFGSGLINDTDKLYCCLYIDGIASTQSIVNNNKFYSASFEGHYLNGVIINGALYNIINDSRFEMYRVENYVKVLNSSMSKNNVFKNCYNSGEFFVSGKFIDEGKQTVIEGSDYRIGAFKYTDNTVYIYNQKGLYYQPTIHEKFNYEFNSNHYRDIRDNSQPIDFYNEDHVYVGIQGSEAYSTNITKYPHTGKIVTLSLLQSASGNDITMPGVALGSHSLPTKRANGRDTYILIKPYPTLNELICIGKN